MDDGCNVVSHPSGSDEISVGASWRAKLLNTMVWYGMVYLFFKDYNII